MKIVRHPKSKKYPWEHKDSGARPLLFLVLAVVAIVATMALFVAINTL